jgi:hypothetical protein
MPLVEAEKTSGFVALRKNHDRAIGETEAEIGVADVELGDRTVSIGFQACNVIARGGGQIAEEGAPGRFANDSRLEWRRSPDPRFDQLDG